MHQGTTPYRQAAAYQQICILAQICLAITMKKIIYWYRYMYYKPDIEYC